MPRLGIRQGIDKDEKVMTAQMGEKLLYKGEEYWMSTEPLGQILPKDRIEKLPSKEPQEQEHRLSNFFRPGDYGNCSSCWRKYIGTWEIDDNKLYLVDLEGYPDKESTDLNYVFPNQERVFASWFTGHIRLPIGELLEYVHMGYMSTFEKDFILELENGIVVREEEIDNRKKCSQRSCGYVFADRICNKSWLFLQNLIKKNENVNVRDKFDKSLIPCAIYSSEFIEFLVEKGTNIKEKFDSHHLAFPLHCAAVYSSNVDVLKFLIERGGDVSIKVSDSNKALLHSAAGNPNIEIWRFLIEKGADVNAKNLWGMSVLYCVARENSNVEVLKYLIEKGADLNDDGAETLIYRATHNSNIEFVKCLVEHGVDVNAKNRRDGLSALHRAAHASYNPPPNVETVKYLIEKGADVNATTDSGATPLDFATPAHFACKNTVIIQNILRKAGGKWGKKIELNHIDDDTIVATVYPNGKWEIAHES